jgi:hypothetical protein
MDFFLTVFLSHFNSCVLNHVARNSLTGSLIISRAVLHSFIFKSLSTLANIIICKT